MNLTLTMDNSLDIVFKAQPNLEWLPWVGKNFDDKKLLIVGDSHFEDGHNWQKGFAGTTRHVMKQCVFDETTKQFGKSKILKSIERTIYNKKFVTKHESQSLWNSSAYFNLVQDLMPDRRTAPSDAQLDKGWRNFLDLISILRPTMIIKCGMRGFGRLGYVMHTERKEWNFSHSEFVQKPRVLNISNGDYKTKIVFIKHPSGRGGFSYSDWAIIVKKHFPDIEAALSESEKHSS